MIHPGKLSSLPAIVLLAAAVLAGCATHADRIQPVREAFHVGQLGAAAAALDESRDARLRNEDVKQLDRAVIELASGRPADAERLLREVRDRFEHLEQFSAAEQAASLVSDDNAKAYSGEDYEKVLIRAMLALTNLMNGGGDAAAYALQVTEKQDQIIQQVQAKNPDDPHAVLDYKQVALGPYVRAMLAEESPLTLDDAARARLQVVNWAPDFRDGAQDLQRAQHEAATKPGHGALYVFALVGRGPIKEEVAEVPTQAALLIADRIISHNANRGLPPTIAPVKVPKVRTFPSTTDAIAVHVDGSEQGQTATLVDVGRMARSQHEARYPGIVAEAVARRVLKKGVIYGAKEWADADPWSASSIALSAVGVAWEATESADTRCWSLLPDQIQVLRVELPAGEHEVKLAGLSGHVTTGRPTVTKVHIREGRNTYILGNFPRGDLVGELLVSERAAGGVVAD